MIKIDRDRAIAYGALATSAVSLAFALNAQTRLGYVEYDVVDKHENAMQLIGQNAQRLNALENPDYHPTHEGERGYFE
jgi:hypothetical protein